MLRRKSLPVGALVMIMILALASIGVGYGLWSKVLTIQGTVETGEVNAYFTQDEVDEGDPRTSDTQPVFWEGDSDCDHPDTEQNDDCEFEAKDVAECTVEYLEGLPNFGPQLLKIKIERGYPSYNCWVQFDVHNGGTIPIKLTQPKIIEKNFTDKEVTVDLVEGFHGPSSADPRDTSSECYHGVFVKDLDVVAPPGSPGWFGAHGPHENPQLAPGGTVFCVIHMHVEQGAEQGREGANAYEFTAQICAYQWNEEPNATCDGPAP